MTRDQYYALCWCYDMAAQDHRVPETVERLALARTALMDMGIGPSEVQKASSEWAALIKRTSPPEPSA